MTLRDIARQRVFNQQLAGTTLKTTADVVGYFGAVQAQEYAQAKWGIGLRLTHLKDGDIERDFNEGRILRTHLLRPTWHFASAQDIRWLLDLTAPRVHAINSYMYRQTDLSKSTFAKCNKIMVRALEGGKVLTRDVINKEFQKNGIIADGHRLGYIMMNAELNGLICSGPRQGNQFTYALLEERVPPAPSISREEALLKLATVYFKSRGPATIADFSTWSDLTIAECKKGIQLVGKNMYSESVDRTTYYFFPESAEKRRMPSGIFLLPVYDEFIMGYKDRSAIIQYKASTNPGESISFDATMMSGGQIIGTWRRVVKGKVLQMSYQFFAKPDMKHREALGKAINQMKKFTGMEVHQAKQTTSPRKN